MQTIVTKYHPSTATRSPRYSATAADGKRITIKEEPEWEGGDWGHFAAVRAFLEAMPRWPRDVMIGGTLNKHCDMVWVFLRDDSPRLRPEVVKP